MVRIRKMALQHTQRRNHRELGHRRLVLQHSTMVLGQHSLCRSIQLRELRKSEQHRNRSLYRNSCWNDIRLHRACGRAVRR